MRYSAPVAIGLICLAAQAFAADYQLKVLDEKVPGDSVSDEIAATLAPRAARVVRGESRVVCDIWLCAHWPVAAAEAMGDVLYPFTPGQLIGVARFARKSSDIRDQDIEEGIYTLRYGQQPVDGAHVGTSPTRDFLLLLPSSQDRGVSPLEYDALTKLSIEASGTSHPCLLSMQRTEGEETVRHNEERDWWMIRLQGEIVHEGKPKPLSFDLVIEGVAE